jgi:hypothetical protein
MGSVLFSKCFIMYTMSGTREMGNVSKVYLQNTKVSRTWSVFHNLHAVSVGQAIHNLCTSKIAPNAHMLNRHRPCMDIYRPRTFHYAWHNAFNHDNPLTVLPADIVDARHSSMV